MNSKTSASSHSICATRSNPFRKMATCSLKQAQATQANGKTIDMVDAYFQVEPVSRKQAMQPGEEANR